jgi:GntR family transcriptional regulator
MIRIDPRDGTPIYRQVIDQVKLAVVAGRYGPGEQLESVSSLAARLKVNPMTISKAYGMLVAEGVAERRKGVGIFVAAMSERKADRERQHLLDDALREAAALIVQLEVPDAEAMAALRRHITAYRAKTRGENP